jgi:Tannase and feruloyl esterase
MNKVPAGLLIVILFSAATFGQSKPESPARSCESLAQLPFANANVTLAQSVAAGTFMPPAMTGPGSGASFYKALPAFCRIAIESTPSADSRINIEVWMPASGWNGRFRAQGNGGFAGYIDYRGMGAAIVDGYATAATNTGHIADITDASWALGHPEKITDFGYRGIHEMTQIAKAAINAFYGRAPEHSYFGSCSNGGRQALMEAQRFPDDYDGILAGAPANFWTHLLTNALWDEQALTLEPGSYIPSSKLPAIAQAVNAACDAQDGVSDGILNDPRQCHLNPNVLLCRGEDSDSCLTLPQVTTLKKLYEGAHDSAGHAIFPGFLPGAETGEQGWTPWITGSGPGKSLVFAFGTGYFADMVYSQADWNYKAAKLDDAVKAADERMARILNSTDPNLAAFKAHGGKLILYHGWNDPAISALNTINYYDSVVKAMGAGTVDAFIRLYMVPGMQHCGFGPGPTRFGQAGSLKSPAPNDPQHNIELALDEWVEKSVAPSAIITTKYKDDDPQKGVEMSRPLCPYPKAAKYKGQGDTNDAANFICSAAK